MKGAPFFVTVQASFVAETEEVEGEATRRARAQSAGVEALAPPLVVTTRESEATPLTETSIGIGEAPALMAGEVYSTLPSPTTWKTDRPTPAPARSSTPIVASNVVNPPPSGTSICELLDTPNDLVKTVPPSVATPAPAGSPL